MDVRQILTAGIVRESYGMSGERFQNDKATIRGHDQRVVARAEHRGPEPMGRAVALPGYGNALVIDKPPSAYRQKQ